MDYNKEALKNFLLSEITRLEESGTYGDVPYYDSLSETASYIMSEDDFAQFENRSVPADWMVTVVSFVKDQEGLW